MKSSTRILAAAAMGIAAAVPAWAHHSHANYDSDADLVMEGQIVELHWLNPHIWINLEIMNEAGQPVVWALEGGSISAVTTSGWTRGDLNIGDDITVRCHPLRDGSNGCLLGFITRPGRPEQEFD